MLQAMLTGYCHASRAREAGRVDSVIFFLPFARPAAMLSPFTPFFASVVFSAAQEQLRRELPIRHTDMSDAAISSSPLSFLPHC